MLLGCYSVFSPILKKKKFLPHFVFYQKLDIAILSNYNPSFTAVKLHKMSYCTK